MEISTFLNLVKKMVLEVGRLCVKTTGRDAMQYCVVVEEAKDGKVLVDGNTRRRAVSVNHIEPTQKTLSISSGADTKAVLAAFEKEGLEVKKSAEPKAKSEKKPQEKKAKKGADKSAKKE